MALVCLQLSFAWLCCALSNSWHLFKNLSRYFDTYFSYRNTRKKDVTKFHVQLALSMLLMLLSHLIYRIFSNTELHILLGQRICIIFSFTEYLILVVLMWMGAEGLLLFQKLVLVFKKTTTLYIIVVSLICWGESTTKGAIMQAASYWTTAIKNFYPYNPQQDVSYLF